jgi:hypothetical protein
MRIAPEIDLTPEEREALLKLTRSGLTSVRLAQSARIVLLASMGMQNKDIATELDVGVCKWDAGVSATPSRAWRESTASEEGTCSHPDARLQTPWHDYAVCRAQHAGRIDHLLLRAASPSYRMV